MECKHSRHFARAIRRGAKLKPLSLALLLAGALSSPAAVAVYEFNIGDIEGTIDSQVSLGVTVRAESRNPLFYSSFNTPPGDETGRAGSTTVDDGNLNFNKHDIVSNVFKGTHGLQLRKDNLGAFARVKYWYDFRLEDGDVHHGSTTSGYVDPAVGGRKKLNDGPFDDLSKFSGIQLMDAFVYGEFDAGGMPLDLRLGRQVISWGESTFIGGGINQINPIDVPAFRRPGATLKDVLMPVGLAYGSLGVTDKATLEAFYQLEWQPFALDGCGTFFAGSDIAAEGCTAVTAVGNDHAFIGGEPNAFTPWNGSGFGAPGVAVARGADKEAKNNGQFGLAGRYYIDSIETEVGAFFMNYHSRRPNFSVTRRGDPTVGAGSNPVYGLAYTEDLKLYGLSFNTTVSGVSLGGEVSYQPDLPVGWSPNEALGAAVGAEQLNLFNANLPETSFLNKVANKGPGETIVLADNFDVYQAQATVINFWDQVMGASRVTLVAEAGVTYTDGLPKHTADPATMRYGRAIQYGNCNTVSNPDWSCAAGGFVTKYAWGYRASIAGSYSDVFAGVNLTPSITWRHDVQGVAPNGNFVDGRRSIALALGADYNGVYTASVSYTSFLTSKWDPTHDRDFISMSIGMSF